MKSVFFSPLKKLNPINNFSILCNVKKEKHRMVPPLLGPPELRRADAQPPQPPPELHDGAGSQPSPQPQPTTASSDPFMSLMSCNFNNYAMTYTENWSPTYVSTGNPCLDFFFHVVPDTPAPRLKEILHSAWARDSLTTLKLVCNLRGVRGTGKSEREGFYTAALWLHENHPKTLASNVDSFAEFGYFKDLLEILYRLLEGSDVRDIEKKLHYKRYMKGHTTNQLRKEDKRIAKARKVLEKHSNDSDFQFLYESVSDYFAECLKNDMKFYESGSLRSVSFAAKWCPSLYSSFDRVTLICESIAKKVFPRESYPEYEGIEEEHYAYRVRDRLRKQVLVPLRKVLELPELYMSANKWNLLPYNRVPSVAMQLYKDKFYKHDQERFTKYLGQVKEGKAKMAAGALLPHEIIRSLRDARAGGEVAELQWKRMIDDLLKEGKLRNSMAICDVSCSMCGTPMDVSVALGILVSELSKDPWKGKLITFSACPELQKVQGDDLRSKNAFVRNMEWLFNTDFQKVFDRILQVAVEGNLKPEQMIKRLFVFSDMEFDEASSNPWETDYEAIVRKFTEKGYGSVVPQIVFWNLRDSKATPVVAEQKGVALLSGFSKNLLKMFLNNDGEVNPEQIMEAAISRKEYQKLVVVD